MNAAAALAQRNAGEAQLAESLGDSARMTSSLTRIFVHANWSTQRRAPVIDVRLERALRAALIEQANRHEVLLISCGFADDHAHVLLRLRPEQTVAGLMKLLKGYSAMTLLHRTSNRCRWQRGYFATSVSEHDVQAISAYVANQRAHHADGSTRAEWEEW
jgi:REP element-mobilizing transposase RayT